MFGQYGIQALSGGELLFGHLEMLRLTINRKIDEKRMFAVWGVEAPWKSKSRRSQGKRMGGGKAEIHHYVTPVKVGRIIVELGGYLDWREAYRLLSRPADNLPFPARFVSQELLDTESRIEAYINAHNVNPFADPRRALYHNYAGCREFISPYHLEWGDTKYH
ncbi:Mitochondrial ribosomal protein L16 [Paragonimus heterotremus]|uniref:Large ribosomal subunit protein uL16m n=1 Tax=Paragonimus heterotremus TaxID=100268 RepID=A0A8J4WD29_9TREM|nr:Mitochondrial ribosomal protein L16 [Paragonimus heterotremus]